MTGAILNSGLDTFWSGFVFRVFSIINCKRFYHARLMDKVDERALGFGGVDMLQPQDVAQSEDKLPNSAMLLATCFSITQLICGYFFRIDNEWRVIHVNPTRPFR